jgi:uncharacterized protein (UPF0335 family)
MTTNRHKVALFSDRLKRVAEAYKADVDSIMEDVKKAEVDPAAVRRLASWRRKDPAKRLEQEIIDEQYRFLAGEIPNPPEPPTEGELGVAIAMFREKATVRQVADELKISVGKAHKLKVLANAFIVQQEMNIVNEAPQDDSVAAMEEAAQRLQAMKREKGLVA